MANCVTLPSNISLQERVLHELAKVFWGKFVLSDALDDPHISRTESLITYRDKVLNNVDHVFNDSPDLFFERFPKYIINKIINAIFNLQNGYYEALVWERKFKSCLPFSILNPVAAGRYQASSFIGLTGRFNDLALVKIFVTDENINMYNRFKMSFYYCLENALSSIWIALESELINPHSFNLEYDETVYFAFWGCKVAKLFKRTSEGIVEYPNNMLYICLLQAISDGYVYAAQFYWSINSVSQKDKFLKCFDYNLIIKAAEDNYSGIVHFLYTLLSQEHKNTQIFIKNLPSMGKIWYCLLNSQFYKCTLHDILTFPKTIPISVYLDIFNSLISNIETFNFPLQKRIFKTLWNNLSHVERTKIFEISSCINSLIRIKEKDLLEFIIKSELYPIKDTMLLPDLEGSRRSVLYELSKFVDDDIILHYVLLFLLVKDNSSQKLRLRYNANGILANFKNDTCSFGEHSLENVRIRMTVNNLDECLNLLNDVLKKIPETQISEI